MAITYDGTNGLFTRLGKLAGLAEAVRAHQSDLKTRIAGIIAEYSSADAYMVADLVASLDAKIREAGGILSDIQSAAEQTLIETCVADSAISSSGILETRDVQSALLYLLRDMKTASETVQETTVTKAAVSAIAGNTGNGTVLYSNIPPLALGSASASMPNVRSERLEIRCIEDAQSKYIRSGTERFQIRGLPAYPNLDYRFPAGSGTRMEMRSVDPAAGTGARFENLARNGGFESFTSNLPDYFATVVGTPGTHFASESTIYSRGASAFRFIGNGATLAAIEQKLADDTGTPLALVSDRLYCLAIIARMSAGASAGVVRVAVINTSTGSPISGASFNISYTVGTSFTWSHAFFRAPLSLPNAMSIRIEQTTAINSGATMYLDSLVLCEAQQIAPGGTGIVIVPGSANWVVNDALIIQNTNNAEGEWNTEIDRMFGMYERGLLLPSASGGSETISDTLIS